jgi:hypothetical protein
VADHLVIAWFRLTAGPSESLGRAEAGDRVVIVAQQAGEGRQT